MIIESDEEESASMMLIDQSIDLAMEEENMEEISGRNSNGKIMDQEYVAVGLEEGFSSMRKETTSDDDDDSRNGFEKSKSKITEFAEMDPELYGLRRSGRGGIKKVCLECHCAILSLPSKNTLLSFRMQVLPYLMMMMDQPIQMNTLKRNEGFSQVKRRRGLTLTLLSPLFPR